jgi:hypothetical protein
MMTHEKFALAFVHVPSGEVGRSQFIFTTREGAQEVCDELDKECATVLHFVLGEKDNIRVVAKERAKKNDK